MKLIFLGAGSAFTVGEDNYQSNLLLSSSENKNLLIDCGSDIRHALYAQNLTYRNISDVYITHLHADHVGGLEWLAFNCFFNAGFKPTLYLSENLVQDLWDHVLCGGLQSLPGTQVSLDTFFNVQPVKLNHVFQWENINFHLVQAVHTMDNYVLIPCFGLFFEINHLKIYFSADMHFCPSMMMPFYECADIIFHDCQTMSALCAAHAQYDELKTLPVSIKNKMWLYHYNTNKKQIPENDGFKGFVAKGQVFNF